MTSNSRHCKWPRSAGNCSLTPGAYPESAPDAVPEQATWTDPRNGGGYAQAQLSHALGVALWLSGQRGDSVFALMKAVMDAPVEHHDAVVIRYDDGADRDDVRRVLSSRRRRQPPSARIPCDRVGEGQMMIDLERDKFWFWRSDGFEVAPQLPRTLRWMTVMNLWNTLVDLALGKEVENCSPGELGARTVEIIDAAYRSAASGKLEAVSR